MQSDTNRRIFDRYKLRPMYTPIAVRLLDETNFGKEGHGYDISVGGVRFELDSPIAPGTAVAIRIMLPQSGQGDVGPGRAVFAFANIVWLQEEDLEEKGPVRMAAVFSRFARTGDRERLLRSLATGAYAKAA